MNERFNNLRVLLRDELTSEQGKPLLSALARAVAETTYRAEPLTSQSFRLRAKREIELEVKPNFSAVRVLVDGRAVPVRYLVLRRKGLPQEERVFSQVVWLSVEIELVTGEQFVLHHWEDSRALPVLKPEEADRLRRELWETRFEFSEHLEPEQVETGWQPVRLYDFDDEA